MKSIFAICLKNDILSNALVGAFCFVSQTSLNVFSLFSPNVLCKLTGLFYSSLYEV
jgi:hypothetical protein